MPNRVTVLDESTGNAPHVLQPGLLVLAPGGYYAIVPGLVVPAVHALTHDFTGIDYVAPSGPAGGDITGSYPNPTLAVIGAGAGPTGSATTVPVVTIDTKGRVTALGSATIAIGAGQVKGTTAGRVPFVGAAPGLALTEDAALAWDNTAKTLTVGDGAIGQALVVNAGGPTGAAFTSLDIMVMKADLYPYFQFLNNNSGGTVNDGFKIGIESNFAAIVVKEAWRLAFYTSNTLRLQLTAAGRLGFGNVAEAAVTAWLHLPAGSAAAGTAPIKLASGALMTAAEVGAVEFLTDKLYATITTGTARKELTLNDTALTSGRVPIVTTNGRLTDDADLTFDTATDTLKPKNLTLTEGDWDDVTLPASRVSVAPGSNPPVYDAAQRCHRYDNNLDRDIDLSFEIQHSYIEGTDVYLHLHGFNSTNAAGNIRMIVSWRVLTPGLPPPAFTVDPAMVYASGSSLNVYIASAKTVSDATATIASVFQFNVQFARNHIDDTYNGDVYVASYGIHYQKNTVGSQTISSK